MNICDVLYLNEYQSESDVEKLNFKTVTTNPNSIDENALFILIKSINFDVNKILSYIVTKKPRAIVCEPDIAFPTTDIPILRVKSTRSMLPFIYSRFHKIDYGKLKFIGVTGTNGKTTTATILAHILNNAGHKIGFIGTGKISLNGKSLSDTSYSMTTPDPEILYRSIKEMEEENCDYIIMEVSSHALYFDKVLPIAFELGIFTNFSSEHLDFHKTLDEYWSSKTKLFKQTKKAILNIDDDRILSFTDEIRCDFKTVGIKRRAFATAKNPQSISLKNSKFTYSENGIELDVNLNMGGDYNIYNALLATAAAIDIGINANIIIKAFESFGGVSGRLDVIESDITVIIDYAHSAQAFKTLLKTVNMYKKEGQKLITVFGCGGNRDKIKRPVMAKYAEELSSFSIVTTDNSRNESEKKIIEEIIAGFESANSFKVVSSRKKAIYEAIKIAQKNDIVLLVGKGAEAYNIDKNGYHSFDEKAIIYEALKTRTESYK